MGLDSFNSKLALSLSKVSTSLRWSWRRFRMRHSVKQYISKPYALTKAQKAEAKAYWGKYTKHFSPLWHELYAQKSGRFDPRYIPDDIMFTEIEGYLNDYKSSWGFDNKCNYDLYFGDNVLMPKTLFRRMRGIFHDKDWNIISKDDAVNLCLSAGGAAVKQSQEAGYGVGVKIWDKTTDDREELEKIIDNMTGDIIAQELIIEHPSLSSFKSKSVACIRTTTILTENGPEYICGYLRLGQGESRVDYLGGCVCSVKEDGQLYEIGYDNMTCNPITKHASGIPFKGYTVPCYDKIKEKSLELHKRLGDFRIVSWDFSLSPEGEPILIEVNMIYGGIMYHQLGSGPIFGDKTDSILNEVYKKDRR